MFLVASKRRFPLIFKSSEQLLYSINPEINKNEFKWKRCWLRDLDTFYKISTKKSGFGKTVTKSVFPTLYRTFRGPKPVIWLSRLEFKSSPFAEIAGRRIGVFINFMNFMRGASELKANGRGGPARTLPYSSFFLSKHYGDFVA